jgi:hypothetical protein
MEVHIRRSTTGQVGAGHVMMAQSGLQRIAPCFSQLPAYASNLPSHVYTKVCCIFPRLQ